MVDHKVHDAGQMAPAGQLKFEDAGGNVLSGLDVEVKYSDGTEDYTTDQDGAISLDSDKKGDIEVTLGGQGGGAGGEEEGGEGGEEGAGDEGGEEGGQEEGEGGNQSEEGGGDGGGGSEGSEPSGEDN